MAIDAANLPATVTAGSAASVEISIDDDDTPRVTLSATSSVTEGDAATVTARLSAPAPAGGATVPLTITDGTAEPTDHGTLASIAIAGGERSGTGTVTTAQDDDTDDETLHRGHRRGQPGRRRWRPARRPRRGSRSATTTRR